MPRTPFLTHSASLWRFRDLVANIVRRDLQLRYKGSTLGLGWSMLHPLVMAGVYTLAFRFVMDIRIEHYPLFLLSGLLPWMFLTATLSSATGSIVDNVSLVRKVAFPRALLPLSALASQFVQFGLMYTVIVPVALAMGVGLSPVWVVLPPLLVLQALFIGGIGLLLATAYVYFRDTRHLLDVLLQVWFWLTPVVYEISLVPERFRGWFYLNPMTHFVNAYHDIVVGHRWPDGATVAAMAIVSAGAAVVGLLVFFRHERRFAELI
jgi:ABC-type polysaccharide/polyol phosphate export permease